MGEASSGTQPVLRSDDRLDSWKEIAAYLDRDVTTVQRWEKREGMPVHRHLHDKMGSVYASRAELDAWAQSRRAVLAADADPAPASAPEGATAGRAAPPPPPPPGGTAGGAPPPPPPPAAPGPP